VEVAPTFFNGDFASLAEKAGIFYRFSLGGRVEGPPKEVSPEECNKQFGDCDGETSCLEKKPSCTKNQRGLLKEGNFEVDLQELRKIVQIALQNLHSSCQGHWPGVVH